MNKPVTKVIQHRIVVDLKSDGSATRNEDPDERESSLEAKADRWFRKRMREGGRG